MKKFLISILAILYFSSSVGADIYLQHYINNISAPGVKKHNSNSCFQLENDKKAEFGKYCCQKENENFNFKTEHIATVFVHYLQHPVSVTLSSTNFIIQSAGNSFLAKESPVSYPLLQINDVAVYLRNCVFLI